MQGNYEVFRHCKICSAYFYRQRYDLDGMIIKLLNEQIYSFWVYPVVQNHLEIWYLMKKNIEAYCELFSDATEK